MSGDFAIARRIVKSATQWEVVEEDGYVKVYRGRDLIVVGTPTDIEVDGKTALKDLEFMDPSYQRSNSTRQKAMKLLKDAGYR